MREFFQIANCRHGRNGAICCWLFLFLRALVLPATVWAQQADGDQALPPPYRTSGNGEDARSNSLIPDYGRFFGILAAGGVLALGAAQVEDADAASDFLSQEPYKTLSDIGNLCGSGWVVGGRDASL